LSTDAAAAQIGVSVSTAKRWITESGGVIPDLAEPAGRYLSLTEREDIAAAWAAGSSKAEIARHLGRHRSTIGRELDRYQQIRPSDNRAGNRAGNQAGNRAGGRVHYRASTAQQNADTLARRPKPTKLSRCPELAEQVTTRLRKRWSPVQIATTLRQDFPDRPEMQVSHETIYQELYVQGRGELRRELTRCLRTGRALRRPHRLPDRRRRRPELPAEIMISARPAEVADRAVPGHWEGDLIIGRDGGSAIGTLVERSTRFVMLLHLPTTTTTTTTGTGTGTGTGTDRSAEAVRDAMITTMRGLPAALRRSMTWDQGREMARHAEVRMALDMPVYFCDPHSPWQRGSNENTNGLLRQYFPKGTDLSRHSAGHLAWVADELNDRPRATLGFTSPAEQMRRLLFGQTGVATTT
jgi:IS30 family transposase